MPPAAFASPSSSSSPRGQRTGHRIPTESCDLWEFSTVKPLHSKREDFGQTATLGADSFGQTATRTSSTDQVVQPYKYVQAGGLLILWVEEDRKRGQLDVPLRGWVVRATPHQSVSLRVFRKYGYGEQPSSKNSPDSLRSPGALTAPPSSAYAPALRVTPPGPLRLRRRLGPSGALPARPHGPDPIDAPELAAGVFRHNLRGDLHVTIDVVDPST